MATPERNDSGASLLEYSMLILFLIVTSVLVIGSFGTAITQIFENHDLVTAEVGAGSVNGGNDSCTVANANYPNC
jgi:hypothetical protein